MTNKADPVALVTSVTFETDREVQAFLLCYRALEELVCSTTRRICVRVSEENSLKVLVECLSEDDVAAWLRSLQTYRASRPI